jgi:hypothetical protein
MEIDDAFIISFPGTSSAEANQWASSLAGSLRDVDQNIIVDRLRERSDTQDFGASLAVVLGTTAATAVAKGIAAWLARQAGARIEISLHGKVIASGLDSKDAARIAEAISHR